MSTEYKCARSDHTLAWAVFIDETERMSRLIKESAETLATSTMEKLTSLYSVRIRIILAIH